MGNNVSTATNNRELVENLIASKYLQSNEIADGFRIVDRGDYVSPSKREFAYADCAWKYNDLHLSAPSIYCFALETLQIKPGMSFLNIGSGTGYLNTIVGLLVGEYGINHGIEINKDVIAHAEVCIDSFMANTLPQIKNTSFCRPTLTHGDAFAILPNMLYDRIYVGAKCTEVMSNYFKQFLKVEGCLILPISNCLCLIQRLTSKLFHSSLVTGVSFASLVSKSPKDPAGVRNIAPFGCPLTLRESCRKSIRDLIEKETLARISVDKDFQNINDTSEKLKDKEVKSIFLSKVPCIRADLVYERRIQSNSTDGENGTQLRKNNVQLNMSEKDIETIKSEHMNNCSTCTKYIIQDNQAQHMESDDENPVESLEELEMDIARFRDRFRWLLENVTIRDEFIRRHQESIRHEFIRRHQDLVLERQGQNGTGNNQNNDDIQPQNEDNKTDDTTNNWQLIDLQQDITDWNDNENVEAEQSITKCKTISKNLIKDSSTINNASCSHEEKAPKRSSDFDNESESKRFGTSQSSSDEDELEFLDDIDDEKLPSSSSSSSSSSTSFTSSTLDSPPNTDTTDSMESIYAFSNQNLARHLLLDPDDGQNVFLTYQQKKEQKTQESKISKEISSWPVYKQLTFIKIFNKVVDELPLPPPIKNYIMIIDLNYLVRYD
ncbi:uncharacterized protein LOC113380945 [Ctenocephalides felis]|uniref:uncharacterized protein LOC113380945 n=1 Tax=Ctenocephalides felis TaxID=7515 RepID=UPI000E6E3047|nr:uncharacterized protein LOC113380945 [Ctenocephalides felis]